MTSARSADDAALRDEIVATAREMSATGVSPGRSGNVSCRTPGGMLITPTALAYADMTAEDIVFVAQDGSVMPSAGAPSSEWRFHLAAYSARPDRSAVVHAHSLHATALACLHKPIPAFHYMVAVAGGCDIPCIAYAPFGTEELASLVGAALGSRDACLMGNHGQIALGVDLQSALELASTVETLAAQYIAALTIGEPKLLGDGEMAVMVKRFDSYGRSAAPVKKHF